VREIIRFRVWNPELKEMYILSKKEYLGGTGIYDDSVGHDKSVWMQFTGLHDRNGREIYEGDIVKWGHLEGNIENPVRIAIVEFDPDLQFRCINLDHIFRFGCFMYPSEALEVIGNIYENPEWLEAEGNEHIPNQN